MKSPEEIKAIEVKLDKANQLSNEYFNSLMIQAEMDFEMGEFTKHCKGMVDPVEFADDMMMFECLGLADDSRYRYDNKDIEKDVDNFIEQKQLNISRKTEDYLLLYRRFLEAAIRVCFNKVSMLKNEPCPYPKDTFVVSVKTLNTKKKSIFPTPEGSIWDDVVFHVINNEEIRVAVNSISKKYNYKEMGFSNKRTKDKIPIEAWSLLTAGFAINKGVINWDSGLEAKRQDTLKHQLSNLRKKLKEFMGIDDDPISKWSKTKGYKLKIRIYDKRDNIQEDSSYWSDINPSEEIEY